MKDLFKAAVITLSDKGAAGSREDKSGPVIKGILEASGFCIVAEKVLMGDEPEQLKALLTRMSDELCYDLVLTTGGTGLSPRDRTPEATLAVADRPVPGIAEYMRYRSFEITPRAMLSRGVSVMRGRTLIINLPGSPKAVRENLEFIMPALEHALEIMTGRASECGGSDKEEENKEKKKKRHEVSFLDEGSRRLIEEGRDKDALCHSRFREDITLRNTDMEALKVGDIIEYEGQRFEITQKGKRCFDECKLHERKGPCFLAKNCAFGKKL